jgi:hypothetical protein
MGDRAMGQLQTLTVKVEERRFYDLLDGWQRVSGPLFHYHDHQAHEKDAEGRLAVSEGKEGIRWLGVTVSPNSTTALAALAVELNGWLLDHSEDVHVRLHLQGMEDDLLDVVFKHTEMNVAEKFEQYWNGKEVRFNSSGGLRYEV